MTSWLITGSNRGIGLELTRQLSARVEAGDRGLPYRLGGAGVEAERNSAVFAKARPPVSTGP
ncbi:MAG: hypothetical protein ACKN89_17335 [Cyanobium sp.]